MDANKIRISGILKESVVDGSGIRYVIYTQGCPHNCEDCHNPSTHSYEGGEFRSVESVLNEVKSLPYIDGVTFSGGEPFEQAEILTHCAMEIKKLGLNIWSYTGYTYEYIQNNIEKNPNWRRFIEQLDFLVDGPFIKKLKDLSLAFRGSSNQRIIDIKKTMEQGEIIEANFSGKEIKVERRI